MKSVAILAALLLAGCSATATVGTPAAPVAPSGLSQLASFTVTDLMAADADAVANNDAIAHACYPALAKFVSTLAPSGGNVVGAFSAFQKARDLHKGVSAGLPDYLKIGCAPLIVDEQMMIARLAAIGAGAAATAGASVFVPFIPIQ